MRTEESMYQRILHTAKDDPRIRAVYMNGSRTDPKAPKDRFQDYDIVYVVEDTKPFIEDKNWLEVFGNRIMMQEPDQLDRGIGYNRDFTKSYAYLMLFTEGVRIDLQVKNKAEGLKDFTAEKMTVKLLDKDRLLPEIPEPTDEDYWVRKPTAGEFDSVTNNFYWCSQNVAKGILRKELPYAMGMYQETMLRALHRMMDWWIGMNHDFEVSTGKLGKYYEKYLPKEYWMLYKEVYPSGDYDSIRESILVACKLFQELGQAVAKELGYAYPYEDEARMTAYLRKEKII